jgi:hypothetical protein
VSNFTMVRRSIWHSGRFRALASDDARYLFFYLLTCPHQSSAGCARIPEAYVLADLNMMGACWSREKYDRVRTELISAGMLDCDPATDEILVPRWWASGPPVNLKWEQGARKACEQIESDRLRVAALRALDEAMGKSQGENGVAASGLLNRASGEPKQVSDALLQSIRRAAGNR